MRIDVQEQSNSCTNRWRGVSVPSMSNFMFTMLELHSNHIWYHSALNFMLVSAVIRLLIIHPASIYLLKVNYRNTGTRCKICSTLTIKKHQNDTNGIILVFLSHLALIFLLLTLNIWLLHAQWHAPPLEMILLCIGSMSTGSVQIKPIIWWKIYNSAGFSFPCHGVKITIA